MPSSESLLDVSASTIDSKMPGYLSAATSPKTPPIESPIQCERWMPSASKSPLMSSAIMSFFWFFTVAVVRASASGDFQHRGHSGGTEAAFGRVDVLVNNAMFHLCKDSVPHMGRRKWRRRMYCSHPMRRATFPVR
jgi:hypothetical protein